jgi:hypothetical protein
MLKMYIGQSIALVWLAGGEAYFRLTAADASSTDGRHAGAIA